MIPDRPDRDRLRGSGKTGSDRLRGSGKTGSAKGYVKLLFNTLKDCHPRNEKATSSVCHSVTQTEFHCSRNS